MDNNAYTLGFVLASEYRKKVMMALQNKSSTPSAISEKTKIYPSHISKTLAELTEKKLVICLTPKLKKGKIYELTKTGKKVLEKI